MEQAAVDQEDQGSKPDRAKISQDKVSKKKKLHKKKKKKSKAGGVVQGESPKFKPQYTKKKEREKDVHGILREKYNR
jgi:hypothetical protein